MPRFQDRLREYGFHSYEEYLQSEHWKAFKCRYRESGRPMCCSVCGAVPAQLHHCTYERVGAELLDDVTPLCRAHHEEVHRQLQTGSGRVERTAKILARLRGGTSPPQHPPAAVKKTAKQRRKERHARHEQYARQVEAGLYRRRRR